MQGLVSDVALKRKIRNYVYLSQLKPNGNGKLAPGDGYDLHVKQVKYRVYGHEMSVRTNWIEAGFALLNGAPDVPHARRPHAAARTRW